MRNVTLLIALMGVMTVAVGGEAVVVMDARQYSLYKQPIGIDKPVVGGEWVIRVGDSCRKETYGPTSKTVDEFKCDQEGNPV